MLGAVTDGRKIRSVRRIVPHSWIVIIGPSGEFPGFLASWPSRVKLDFFPRGWQEEAGVPACVLLLWTQGMHIGAFPQTSETRRPPGLPSERVLIKLTRRAGTRAELAA